jgi:putative FmdB family regulatory protein
MPIYEYICGACGHHLEALQKMTEAPLRKCPDCGKSQLKRLVSASRFRLKGSGWYETDFKDKNETKRNLVEKGGAEAAESSSEKSTDTGAKGEAAKAVADAKGAAPAKPSKASPPKATPRTRKPVAKPRAKTARR